MKTRIENEELENKLNHLLNPVLPSRDFIKELQTRLKSKGSVALEYPNYLLSIILISTGLFFGIVILWGLKYFYHLFLSSNKE